MAGEAGAAADADPGAETIAGVDAASGVAVGIAATERGAGPGGTEAVTAGAVGAGTPGAGAAAAVGAAEGATDASPTGALGAGWASAVTFSEVVSAGTVATGGGCVRSQRSSSGGQTL